MKIRRYEDRTINIIVEYEIDATDEIEAFKKLKEIDGTDEYYNTKKELVSYNSDDIEELVQINEPMWIDDMHCWQIKRDGKFVEKQDL